MSVGVDVFTAGPVWTITYDGSAGTALPLKLCAYDLIPMRLVWRSLGAVAGDAVVLQSKPVGGTETIVYSELAAGADFDSVEQRPAGKEKWPGPIYITTFASGELLIYL